MKSLVVLILAVVAAVLLATGVAHIARRAIGTVTVSAFGETK